MLNRNPFQSLGISYNKENDDKNPEETSARIKKRYLVLVQAIKYDLERGIIDVDKANEKLKILDSTYKKIETYEKRQEYIYDKSALINEKIIEKVQYKRCNNDNSVKTFGFGNKTYFIRLLGRLEFKTNINLHDYINEYEVSVFSEGKHLGLNRVMTDINMREMKESTEYREKVLGELFSEESLKVAKKSNARYIGEIEKKPKGEYIKIFNKERISASFVYLKKYKEQEEIIHKEVNRNGNSEGNWER